MLAHLSTYKARYGVLVGTVFLSIGGYLTGTLDVFTAGSQIVHAVFG